MTLNINKTEFDPPSHPALITVDWEAFDAEFGFSLPDKYRQHIELKGNSSPLRYTEYEEFYKRRSWHLSAALRDHAQIIHPERGPLNPRYVPYSVAEKLFNGFREWYDKSEYYQTLATGLSIDEIDYVTGIGDLYDAAQALDERIDWPTDGHPVLSWQADHDKKKYRDYLSEWHLTATHDDLDMLFSLDYSDLPVEPKRIYTPPRNDDQIIFQHERYHRAPEAVEPWDERTEQRLNHHAAEIGLQEMDTTTVSWLFEGINPEVEIPHRPIEYHPLEGKEAVGYATVYEYEKCGDIRYLAAWPDNLENDMWSSKARLCRFSSPPTAQELKQARALTDIRQQFYFNMGGLNTEFECLECGQQTHWLDIARDDTHSLSLAEKAEHADRRNCGCIVSEGRDLGDFNIEFDPPDHPALLSVDWEAFEADIGVAIPDEVRYLIKRRGENFSIYTSEYDDFHQKYSAEIDETLTDHASLVHPDRGPLDRQYVPYKIAKGLFKAFSQWYGDSAVSLRPLVTPLDDDINFMKGISDLYDAAQALDDRIDWSDGGHPTLVYERAESLMYGSGYLDVLGGCQLSASHDDPTILSSLDYSDLPVEAERVYTPPTETDRLVFRHERYHRVPWADEPWDERTHQYLNEHEAAVDFLTIDTRDRSSMHPLKDGETDSQIVDYVSIGRKNPIEITPLFTEGFATVYEYEQHGETRYLAEWPERLEYNGYSQKSRMCLFSSPPTEQDIEVARTVTGIRTMFRDESLSDEFECGECEREIHWLDLTTEDSEPMPLIKRAEHMAHRDCGC